MRCRACGNTLSFLTEGKDLRIVDTRSPYSFEQFFVPTKAVCINGSCPSYPCTDVELDPLHEDLEPFAAIFGLR